MLGEIRPGRGPGSLGFASHSRALPFAVTARLLLSSGSLPFPSQDSFVFTSSGTSSLTQLGRSSSGEEKDTRLYQQPAGSSEGQAQGRVYPQPRPTGHQELCSTQQLPGQGRVSRLSMCPSTFPMSSPSTDCPQPSRETPQSLWLRAGTAMVPVSTQEPGFWHRRNPVSRTYSWLRRYICSL